MSIRRKIGRRATAGLLFVAVLGLGLVSASRQGQLGSLAGITDEYLALGLKLRVNGTLGLAKDEPAALRPPGYPAFIAAVVWAFGADPRHTDPAGFVETAQRVVTLSQAFLLAAVAALLYLWLSASLRDRAAIVAAGLVGLNPHSLALVGLFHYDLLHWLSLVLAAWGTARGLRSARPALALFGAGLLWGGSNLVRPVTLLLPAFLLAAWWLWERRALQRVLVWSACLAVGMAVALTPWTLRNWRATGRLVAVADNPWSTLWGQTVRPLRPDPNRYLWYGLFRDDLMPVFTRVTGSPAYDYVLQNRLSGELDAAFRAEALRNLRERPLVYLGNVARSLASFATGFSSVLVTVQAHLQRCLPPPRRGEPSAVRQEWFLPGRVQDFHPPYLARAYTALAWCVTLLAALGLWTGARGRESLVVLVAAILLCMGLTQALFFQHMLHYAAKWPLLVVLAASWLDAAAAGRRGMRALAGWLGLALVAFSFLLGSWLLYGPVGRDPIVADPQRLVDGR